MNKEHIDLFLQETEATLHAFWGSSSGVQFLKDVHEYTNNTLNKLRSLVLEYPTNDASDESMLITHLWSLEFKDYMILLRDVSFNYMKACQFESTYPDENGNKIKQSSYSIINEALTHLKHAYANQYAEFNKNYKQKEKTIANWKVQNDPWPTVFNQTGELVNQIENFIKDFHQYKKVGLVYEELSTILNQFVSKSEATLDGHKEILNQAQETIKTLLEENRIGQLNSAINHLDSNKEEENKNFSDISSQIDEILKDLGEKYKYPIELEDNIIIVKETNLKSDIKTWLESEIYPMLYEMDDIRYLSDNETKMALVNIKNRANLFKPNQDKEEVANELKTLNNAINTFNLKTAKQSGELQATIDEYNLRLGTNLNLSSLFDPNVSNFDTSIEKSIRSFGLRQNKYFKIAKEWCLVKANKLSDLYQNIEEEDKLSASERINRYLDQVFVHKRSSSYANIFLTKGYIGESFIVGRDKDLERIDLGVGKWHDGKRGTVLLSGQRMSGRTLFGNLISKRHFVKKTVKLKPNTNFSVCGRNLKSNVDLGQSLSEVVKYGLREKVMVWIDNIELWQDDKISLLTNVRALLKVMDTHSDKIFFVISSTHWVSNHLNSHQSWKDAFQISINMDTMSRDNLAKAISIRHGATHKNLVDIEGQLLSPYHLKKQSTKIHIRSNGIIGVALHQWANSIRDLNENDILQDLNSKYYLPQIINETTGPILYSIVMNRGVNEYAINKWLGGNFQSKYKAIVQRLNHIGLLSRRANGVLTLKKQVVNDLAKQLHDNHWIDKSF